MLMSSSSEKWVDGLQFSSLCWPPPQDAQQRQAQIMAYVEYFSQFTSERFPEDIAELIHSCYPSKEKRLLDEVLAIFVLHHPEHGHAVVHPILSCIIDGTLLYDKNDPPFSSFISLVCPSSEYSEQWALACGEILRVLTHYNRPIYKIENQNTENERSNSGSEATTSTSSKAEARHSVAQEHERRPLRPLTPWITDILLAAPLGIRSDYFRWCGGVMGKYAAGGELKPPTTACGRGSGKHPQLMPSTPRWAVANGAGVILSVCDEEVARYETANLTAAAVPALLLPPPTSALDEHLVAGLPALEPYARLFHRYYAIATPSATQRLLLGLLEAPPSWAPDALDAAVQLVELLRAAEDYATGMRLPRNWMHLHFLRAIGTAMSLRAGIAADAAAALLFRILSQPTLLFPPLRHVEGVDIQHEPLNGYISYKNQMEASNDEATIEATAQGIASMLCAHGPEVEWRICTIWEAAYGLLPLSSSVVDLPEIIVATPLQPPALSWNLYIPLLKVLEYLPRGSPSEACLMRIFVATVEAILRRTFPLHSPKEQTQRSRYPVGLGPTSKNLAVAELRTMIHSLFLESCASTELASRLLFVVLTVCVSHEALPNGSKKPTGADVQPPDEESQVLNRGQTGIRSRTRKKQGPVATFDSFVLAAVCALACELQLFPLVSRNGKCLEPKETPSPSLVNVTKVNRSLNELPNGLGSAICHTRRILGILEALFSLKPSNVGTSWSHSSNEIVAAAMVAAHVSELFGRSKACMHALSVLMRCKWDNEIYTRASSLYNLIDVHGKAVASIVNKAEPLEAHIVQAPVWRDALKCINSRKRMSCCSSSSIELEDQKRQNESLDKEDVANSEALLRCDKALLLTDVMLNNSRKEIATLPVDASDLANFLTTDRHIGFNCSAQALLRIVLAEKQELCFSVVSLLWHKLIASPETEMIAESTSAQQGWRQVVDALCNVVLSAPTKASTAVVLQVSNQFLFSSLLKYHASCIIFTTVSVVNFFIHPVPCACEQAEKDLQPWIAKDDEQGQKMWRINQRIVKLLVELMRNHVSPEALIILASASDLLLRATDGMLIDGEACTLPQLELLEATARAVELMLSWGDSSSAVVDGLGNLLKCRLPATIRCLSNPSAHVRALSTSVLRHIIHIGSVKSSLTPQGVKDLHAVSFQFLTIGIIDWRADIEKCLRWEANSRRATGLTLLFLDAAAKELGCTIPS
ncbi:protein GIGANTEA-like isoform X2 [Aristolochia californica]|uniref:protein GIGANTEA-like isoform X2 n=1 Tax=Aristolochia californica TaxID=171875 RepID=UPI0035DC8952